LSENVDRQTAQAVAEALDRRRLEREIDERIHQHLQIRDPVAVCR
jgi:hypothetical protein